MYLGEKLKIALSFWWSVQWRAFIATFVIGFVAAFLNFMIGPGGLFANIIGGIAFAGMIGAQVWATWRAMNVSHHGNRLIITEF